MDLGSIMESFNRDGYALLGKILSDEEIATLNTRIDDLMMGKIQYDSLLMQLDPSAKEEPKVQKEAEEVTYKKSNVEVDGQTLGWKGESMAYRKIGEAGAGLECDDLFMALMRKPIFKDICHQVYGAVPISVYRSMVMSKPAGGLGGGSPLPWHQDGGDWWALTDDPLAFVWVALTASTTENGAVQVVKGSHKNGILSKRGHTLSDDHIKSLITDHPENVFDVELQPGEAFLCHNFTAHRSGINTTELPRRGFSCNYINGKTRVLDPKPELAGPIGVPGAEFARIFD